MSGRSDTAPTSAVVPATLAVGADSSGADRQTRARWLLARLRAMERRELAYRARTLARAHVEQWTGVRLAADAVAVRVRGPGEPWLLRLGALATSRELEELVAAAERIDRGEFEFFGYRAAVLTRPLDYARDPFTGRAWPRRHGLLLDYRTTAVGDPKWCWELNRLQHVPLLLLAGQVGGAPRFTETAQADLRAWLDQDRPGRGIAWCNGFEPALRAISLALALDLLRGEEMPAGLHVRLVGSLRQHLAWIARYPSIFSSGNNHRLAELAGTAIASALVPELGQEAELGAILDELRTVSESLFAADGGYLEQAYAYGLFARDLLLVTAAVMEAADRPTPPWLSSLLERVATALALQVRVGEPELRYGDADEGHVATVPVAPATFAWSVEGRECSAHLSQTGLAIFRVGETRVTVDVGPLGWGTIAAHGHADALAVTLSRGAVRLVDDPGTGSFFGSRGVRDAFRGTAFHATVAVDERDQAEIAGAFLWKTRPQVEVLEVDVSRRLCRARHLGYLRLPDPVIHERLVVLLEEDLLLVRDSFFACGRHLYDQCWPFPPEADVEVDGRTIRAVVGGTAFSIITTDSPEAERSVVAGSLAPFRGWWSERLESVRPAPHARIRLTATGPAVLTTVLALHEPGTLPEVDAALSPDRLLLVGGAG